MNIFLKNNNKAIKKLIFFLNKPYLIADKTMDQELHELLHAFPNAKKIRNQISENKKKQENREKARKKRQEAVKQELASAYKAECIEIVREAMVEIKKVDFSKVTDSCWFSIVLPEVSKAMEEGSKMDALSFVSIEEKGFKTKARKDLYRDFDFGKDRESEFEKSIRSLESGFEQARKELKKLGWILHSWEDDMACGYTGARISLTEAFS